MTQEELQKSLEKYFTELKGYNPKYRTDGIIKTIINKHVAEVIGEDERPSEYKNFGIEPIASEQIRNKLRAEQRNRAGVL